MRGMEILAGLNGAQKEAVTHGRGPLLVLAGPGSGKTRVLTHRVAWLIASGLAKPEEILAVTFTNKAADEMKARLEGLLGADAAAKVRASTFHSACVYVLRRDGAKVGIDPSFVIVDSEAQEELLRRVADELDADFPEVKAAMHAVSYAKNCLAGPAEFPSWACDGAEGESLVAWHRRELVAGLADFAAEVYLAYQRLLRKMNGLDFDDLLVEAVRLFREKPEVLEKWRRRWKWVLVDEYQDTNRAQYEWLRLLVSGRRKPNVTAVGDPDQSIYGWRAADIENILRFRQDFPGAKVVALEANYRSVPAVTSVAARLIRCNLRREDKTLVPVRPEGGGTLCLSFSDDRAEAAYVAERVLALRKERGLSWSDFAVLYRTNALSRLFEEALARRGIPYVVVGSTGFWGRKEVKDVLAHLRVALNPRDAVSLKRIVLLQPGVGKALGERVASKCLDGLAAREALAALADSSGVSAKARSSLRLLADVLKKLEEGVWEGRPAAELCREAAESTGYLGRLMRDASEEGRERVENVQALVSAAAEVGSVEELLERAALASAEGEEGRRDAVRLMTLHKAKGLEFPVVFLVAAEEGFLPHYRNSDGPPVEEERRLCFVGVTRAKDLLHLTWCRARMIGDKRRSRYPSRFLSEMGLERPEGAEAV